MLPDIFIPYHLISGDDASAALEKAEAGAPIRLADFSPDIDFSSLRRFVKAFRSRFPKLPPFAFRSFFSFVPKFTQRLEYVAKTVTVTSVSKEVRWGKTMVFPTFFSSDPDPTSAILSSR